MFLPVTIHTVAVFFLMQIAPNVKYCSHLPMLTVCPTHRTAALSKAAPSCSSCMARKRFWDVLGTELFPHSTEWDSWVVGHRRSGGVGGRCALGERSGMGREDRDGSLAKQTTNHAWEGPTQTRSHSHCPRLCWEGLVRTRVAASRHRRASRPRR